MDFRRVLFNKALCFLENVITGHLHLQCTAFLRSRNTYSNWRFLFSLFWEKWGTAWKIELEGWAPAQSTAVSAEVQAPGLRVSRKIIRKCSDILSIKKALIVIIIIMVLMVEISEHVSMKDTCQLAIWALCSKDLRAHFAPLPTLTDLGWGTVEGWARTPPRKAFSLAFIFLHQAF